MANETMVLLEKIVVPAAGASSVTFTNIPQSYTDLVVKLSLRKSDSNTLSWSNMTFNSSSSGYSARRLYGNGAGAASDTNPDVGTSSLYIGSSNSATSTGNTFSNFEVYIPNYTSSNNKSVSVDSVQEDNASSAYQFLVAGLWSNSAAITRIDISGFANYVQYSTFYLYGIAKQGVTPTNAPAATGGDSIVFDGTYWIHTFYSSGTFTPKKNLTCDYLVVAGGGSGGNRGGGGGGGGYAQQITSQALALNTAFTVTVGAGGAASTFGAGQKGTSGSNSSFNSTTSNGGGMGGVQGDATGGTGGNGGGGGEGGSGGTGNQGFNGGAAYQNNGFWGGGGGGSTAAGANATASPRAGGNGGAGLTSSYSGTSTTYGGGGGGCAWDSGTAGTGSGGGGDGAAAGGNSTAGAVNRGGGGGGGGYLSSSGNGGSGIVIVRYAA